MSKDYFQKIASEWDRMQKSFFSNKIRDKAFELAGIVGGKTAADVGAGTGYVTEGLLANGINVIAVDQSENMLNLLQNKFNRSEFDDVHLICKVGDAEKLPIDGKSVNYAFANMYLHHVENPVDAIKEMTRILKPGGKVVITDLDSHEFDFLEEEHYDRWKGFDRENIRKWFEAAGLINVHVISTEESCSSESAAGETASITVFLAIGEKQQN